MQGSLFDCFFNNRVKSTKFLTQFYVNLYVFWSILASGNPFVLETFYRNKHKRKFSCVDRFNSYIFYRQILILFKF